MIKIYEENLVRLILGLYQIYLFQMRAICTLCVVFLYLSVASTEDTLKITAFKAYPHEKNCYTQGLFFLNSTHVFESCGMYNQSYYRVLKYEEADNNFNLQQTFKSITPIDKAVFLEGATWFPKTNNIYLLTWRQKKVYRLNRDTFESEQVQRWAKDGWGLTNNQTHMFVTDGGPIIYVVDQNFKILEEKIIIDQNGRNVYSINELEYVVQKGGKAFIYANVYMERRIVKIDIVTGRVVKEYDMLKVIQNQKALKYDEVINGIAFHESSGKFLLTGKNWGNFYLVSLD